MGVTKAYFSFSFQLLFTCIFATTSPDLIFCNDETVCYANVGTAMHTNLKGQVLGTNHCFNNIQTELSGSFVDCNMVIGLFIVRLVGFNSLPSPQMKNYGK